VAAETITLFSPFPMICSIKVTSLSIWLPPSRFLKFRWIYNDCSLSMTAFKDLDLTQFKSTYCISGCVPRTFLSSLTTLMQPLGGR
jgi:hypothetical protein